MKDFALMTVKQLADELRARGMPSSGRKSVLVRRLEQDEAERERAMDIAEEEEVESLDKIGDEDDGDAEEEQDDDDDEEEDGDHEEDEEEDEDEEEGEENEEDEEDEEAEAAGGAAVPTASAADLAKAVPPHASWVAQPSAFSWVASVNSALAAICLALYVYNSPEPAGSVSSSEIAIPLAGGLTVDVGPTASSVLAVLGRNFSLVYTALLLMFTVAYTHSEPERCRRLVGGDLIRVRSYLLNTQLFYLVFASSEFATLPTGGAIDSLYTALKATVSGAATLELNATSAGTMRVVLAELHQVLGIFLYFAVYRGLAVQKKAEVLFNTFALAGTSLLFLNQYTCMRADGCAAQLDGITLFPLGVTVVKAAWFLLGVYNLQSA